MIESWVDVDDCVCAATIEDDDGEQLHLSVEPLPDGGWDWTVWRSQVESRYGTAASRTTAMAAAEAAAAGIGNEGRER